MGKLSLVLGEDTVIIGFLVGAEHADAMFETSKNVTRVLDFIDSHLK